MVYENHLGEPKEDENWVDNRPYCKKCGGERFCEVDIGDGKIYIMPTPCTCRREEIERKEKQDRIEKTLQDFKKKQNLSMMGAKYLDVRFENSEITNSNKAIYEKCKNYVANAREMRENNIGLYIYGDNSSGKTHLTACMCNALLEKGYNCCYTSIPRILAEIQKSYNDDTALGLAGIVEKLSRKSFLFIDDLGKEFIGQNTSKFAEKTLLEILNCCYNNAIPTIFSSNYSLDEFLTKFNLDKAILERVNEMATRVFQLNGDNFRDMTLKRKEKLAKSLGI